MIRVQNISLVIRGIVSQPHRLGHKALTDTEAATILLGDDILAIQEFCNNNVALCSSQALWSALFEDRFPDVHSLFREVADGLFSAGHNGVTPYPFLDRGSYNPLFWRDSYTDLFNMPKDLQSVVAKLINQEALDEDELACMKILHRDFWTIGVVLANIDESSRVTVQSILLYGLNLLSYVLFPEDAISQDDVTSMLHSDLLGQEAMLYLIESKLYLDTDTLFGSAARLGIANVVTLLIQGGANPGYLMTLYINLASRNGHVDVVTVLLKDGRADPSDRSLFLASENGHAGVVDILLQDGRANPRQCYSSPLTTSIKGGHTEVVSLLLDDGRADPSPGLITMAIEYGHAGILKLLLKDTRILLDGPGVREEISHSITSSTFRDPDVVEVLLKHEGFLPTDLCDASLIAASSNGHVGAVRFLLEDGRANPTARDNSPIILAANNGHDDVLDLLLKDPRFDPTKLGDGLITSPTNDGHVGTIKLLLKDGRVPLKPWCNRVFSSALKFGNPEIIELLFGIRGLEDDKSYRLLSRPVLRRIARRKGLRIHAALGKEEMVRLLTERTGRDERDNRRTEGDEQCPRSKRLVLS